VTGHVEAARDRDLPLTELPVRGELRAESAVISALPLFVPEIDHSEGRLNASVRVGGTLGDPLIDGDFQLRDGRLDLYRTNLSLTGATLDGRFVGDTLDFEGTAQTRKGAISLSGRFSWPDGVMQGSLRLTGENVLVADTPDFRIQASPDLTVTAADGEYTVTGEVRIPWARITPRDLSTSASVSPDERIVGEAAPAEPPPADDQAGPGDAPPAEGPVVEASPAPGDPGALEPVEADDQAAPGDDQAQPDAPPAVPDDQGDDTSPAEEEAPDAAPDASAQSEEAS
jgi:hypothetical protein